MVGQLIKDRGSCCAEVDQTGNIRADYTSGTGGQYLAFVGNEQTFIRLAVRNFPIFRSLFIGFATFCLLFWRNFQVGATDAAKGFYAVIIGLKTFQDPQVPPLNIADRDAKDFYKFLKDREKYFSKTHISSW